MRRAAPLLALAALAAPALAQDSDEARFIALVAKQGCVITEQEGMRLLPTIGITMSASEGFVDAMIARGDAEFDDGTLTLLDTICPPADGTGQ